MSGYVELDSRVTVDFYDIAEKMIDDNVEDEFLNELAIRFRETSKLCEDAEEKKYFLDAYEKTAQLAQWLRDCEIKP